MTLVKPVRKRLILMVHAIRNRGVLQGWAMGYNH